MPGRSTPSWAVAALVLAAACGGEPSANPDAVDGGPAAGESVGAGGAGGARADAVPGGASGEAGAVRVAQGPGRDSAGVRIVEWEGEPEAAATLSVQRLHVHGQVQGDYTFAQFGPAVLLDDGRAVVADLMNRELVEISADGAEATVIASGGEGPGDLGAVRGLRASGGDTLWIQDGTNQRFVRFVAGTVDATWSVEDRPVLSMGLRTIGRDPSGAFLMVTSAFSPRFSEPWLAGHMVRFDPRADVVDTVAMYDLAPRMTQGEIDPFSPFGEVTAAGGRWVQTRSDQPRVVWRDPDGTVVQILRWNPEPTLPVEQDWLDFVASIEDNIRRNNPELTEAVIQQLIQQQAGPFIPRPRQPLPLFFSPVGDQEGRVWLPEYMPDRQHPRRYRVVDADGRWLGVVEFPAGTIVMDARGDRVLGRIADDSGAQSLVVYRLDIGAA